MADDATDSAFGIILFLLFLALLGYAAGGGTWPSSGSGTTTTANPTPIYTTTPGTTTSTAKSTTNIPTGTLKSCPGKVIANKTATSNNGSVNLKIYFSTQHGDRNCAVATRFGWPDKTQGRLTVKMRFSDYDGNQWPEYAQASSQPHTTKLRGIYLDDTYNRCITSSATFTPFTGMAPVTVRVGPVGCN
jgi:hypothetical protein